MSNHSVALWESLRYEILHAQDEDLALEALETLQAIASKLSQLSLTSDPSTPLARFLTPVLRECNEQLREPQQKQAKPAGQILSWLSKASKIALSMIANTVIPPLMNLYQSTENVSQRRAFLDIFVQVFDSAIAISGNSVDPSLSSDFENPLGPYKDRFFGLATQALTNNSVIEVSFRTVAVKILLRFCLLRNYLQENEISMIIQYLDEVLLSENLDACGDLKDEMIQALAEISKIWPGLVMDTCFPAFLARLPDSASSDSTDYLIVLEGLARLSTEKTISDTLTRRLLSKLAVVLQGEGAPAYPRAILSTLHYIISSRTSIIDLSTEFYYEKIVVGLIRQTALASLGEDSLIALNEELTMDTLGRLVNIIVRAINSEKQEIIGSQIYTLFTNLGFPVALPIEGEASKEQRMTMILSTWLMASVPRSVSLILLKLLYMLLKVTLDIIAIFSSAFYEPSKSA